MVAVVSFPSVLVGRQVKSFLEKEGLKLVYESGLKRIVVKRGAKRVNLSPRQVAALTQFGASVSKAAR